MRSASPKLRKVSRMQSSAKALAASGAPLPSLLDEVFGQDFAHRAGRFQAAGRGAGRACGACSRTRTPENWRRNGPAAKKARGARRFSVSGTCRRRRTGPKRSARRRLSLKRNLSELRSPPLAHARNRGGRSKKRFAKCCGRSLTQWLNENMPRILEKAIREEMATRGYLPKVET